MKISKLKIYNKLGLSFINYLPENNKYCINRDINSLHRETCALLNISDIYPEILWSFNKNFRNTLGEASYWMCPEAKKMQWRIKYCSKSWMAIGAAGRRNTIIHEVCHLAVEKIYGHKTRAPEGEECVLDHGKQWQDLMWKCKEPPFLEIHWNYDQSLQICSNAAS